MVAAVVYREGLPVLTVYRRSARSAWLAAARAAVRMSRADGKPDKVDGPFWAVKCR